jgi:hypothetical protein
VLNLLLMLLRLLHLVCGLSRLVQIRRASLGIAGGCLLLPSNAHHPLLLLLC